MGGGVSTLGEHAADFGDVAESALSGVSAEAKSARHGIVREQGELLGASVAKDLLSRGAGEILAEVYADG